MVVRGSRSHSDSLCLFREINYWRQRSRGAPIFGPTEICRWKDTPCKYRKIFFRIIFLISKKREFQLEIVVPKWEETESTTAGFRYLFWHFWHFLTHLTLHSSTTFESHARTCWWDGLKLRKVPNRFLRADIYFFVTCDLTLDKKSKMVRIPNRPKLSCRMAHWLQEELE